MERFILKKLLDWKNSPYRKPLILKGVRQVGKTWILKEFGKRYYENTAYFNFDENEEYKIKLSTEGQKIFADGRSQIFDYITIHQGILDKIYNVFGIKENYMEKHKVTNALHRFFSKPPKSNEVKIKSKKANAFLPNFIIHSGRSKPNEKDMPQHQPFVQFAAVDHAVKDCKYTLVELLATAHYEDNNNN